MPDLLSTDQIAQYAYNAGFRGRDLVEAVSIALAESSGDPNSYNPETAAGGDPKHGSRGLWQIYGVAHPGLDDETLFDPQKNANAAYQVFTEANNTWVPWSTYANGMASKFEGDVSKALKASPLAKNSVDTTNQTAVTGGSVPGVDWVSGLLGKISPTVDAVNKISGVVNNFDPEKAKEKGVNLAFMVFGLTLVIIGVWLFFEVGKSPDAIPTEQPGTETPKSYKKKAKK